MAGDTLNLVTYLEELPPIKLSKIYTSQWTCQAVLRSLPPLAKQYVLRLLFVSTAAPESEPSHLLPLGLSLALAYLLLQWWDC